MNTYNSQPFVDEIRELSKKIHANAVEHGFWESPEVSNFGLKIALIHSEVSEALEAHREGNSPSPTLPQFSWTEEELADAMIRILDLAENKGFDLGNAILSKHNFNCTRPHKHGKQY
jgi:NTP pyrophosphatase (non-canonical NTP hydrolase)